MFPTVTFVFWRELNCWTYVDVHGLRARECYLK